MTEQVISQLRRRMIEDMSIRKFAAKTQHDYVQRVKDLATFLGRSPGTAEAEDVRRFSNRHWCTAQPFLVPPGTRPPGANNKNFFAPPCHTAHGGLVFKVVEISKRAASRHASQDSASHARG